MSNRFFDWSNFTDAFSAFDIFKESLRSTLDFDSWHGKTRFKAVALTKGHRLSNTESRSTGYGKGAYVYKARIIDENSPHSLLPDPCDLHSANTQAAINSIQQHTTFVAPKSAAIVAGDLVEVELEKGWFKSYNLQYGRHIGKITAAANNKTFKPAARCIPLGSVNFNSLPEYQLPEESDRWPGKYKPNAVYTKCTPSDSAKNPGGIDWEKPRFKKINTVDLAKKIIESQAKVTTGEARNLAIAIISVAISEQPLDNRAAVGGFEYNHYGITGHGNWGTSYTKCVYAYLIKRKTTHAEPSTTYYYLGFESEEKSIAFMKDKGTGKGWHKITTASQFGKEYMDNWLGTKEKDRTGDSYNNKVAAYAANWTIAQGYYNEAVAALANA